MIENQRDSELKETVFVESFKGDLDQEKFIELANIFLISLSYTCHYCK